MNTTRHVESNEYIIIKLLHFLLKQRRYLSLKLKKEDESDNTQ